MEKSSIQGDNQQEIGYLAGIIDGEGYIALSLHQSSGKRNVLVPRIGITNTDPGIIKKCKDILDKFGFTYHISSKFENSGKESYTITIHRQKWLIDLCNLLIDHLAGIKKAKAQLVRDFCENQLKSKHGSEYSERDKEIFKEFLKLNKNHKGPPTRIIEFLNDYTQS